VKELLELTQNNVQEFFGKMMNYSVSYGEISEEKPEADSAYISVMDILAHGDKKGYISLHLTSYVAEKMLKGMLGVDKENPEKDEIESSAREALNIIGGRLKTILERDYPEMTFSLPRTVSRINGNGGADPAAKKYFIPFCLDNDLFYVELCI
jgi:CheY-specific phosphatase CheX